MKQVSKFNLCQIESWKELRHLNNLACQFAITFDTSFFSPDYHPLLHVVSPKVRQSCRFRTRKTTYCCNTACWQSPFGHGIRKHADFISAFDCHRNILPIVYNNNNNNIMFSFAGMHDILCKIHLKFHTFLSRNTPCSRNGLS